MDFNVNQLQQAQRLVADLFMNIPSEQRPPSICLLLCAKQKPKDSVDCGQTLFMIKNANQRIPMAPLTPCCIDTVTKERRKEQGELLSKNTVGKGGWSDEEKAQI